MLVLKKALRKVIFMLTKVSPVFVSKILYYLRFGKRLNLKNPKSINEKLMWLKLYEDDSLKVICADKYLVRDYISRLGYSSILVDLYNVYERADQIEFNQLPEKFIMKCTHGSGFNITCQNKREFNREHTKTLLKKWMKVDYSLINCEPHYAKIKPRIIVERLLEDSNTQDPIDYQIHCFHGEPQIIEIIFNRWGIDKQYILVNRNWDILPYNEASARFKGILKKPEKLQEMLDISRKLSRVFTYVRVDLYYCDYEIYFGELTFTPDACLDIDFINNAEYKMGKLLDLQVLHQQNLMQSLFTK